MESCHFSPFLIQIKSGLTSFHTDCIRPLATPQILLRSLPIPNPKIPPTQNLLHRNPKPPTLNLPLLRHQDQIIQRSRHASPLSLHGLPDALEILD